MLFSLQLHKRLRKPKEGFISCITHQRCSTKHGLRIGTNVRTRVNAGTQENFLVDVKVVPSWLVIAIPFMGQTTHQDILWIGHKLIRHGTVTSIEADLKIFYISLWRLIDWLIDWCSIWRHQQVILIRNSDSKSKGIRTYPASPDFPSVLSKWLIQFMFS